MSKKAQSKWELYPTIHLSVEAGEAVRAQNNRIVGTRAGTANAMICAASRALAACSEPGATVESIRAILAGESRYRIPSAREAKLLEKLKASDPSAVVILMSLDGKTIEQIKAATGKTKYFREKTMDLWNSGKFWGDS